MFSAFQTFGKLGALASSVARAWSPLALWPDGISSAGMWISPRTLDSQWADYTGTTPVATPGTVADSSNPVGLALDIRAGATVLTDPGLHMLQSTSVNRPLLSAYDGQTLGPGDTYDGTGYPVFQKYNGTNSSMATAAFAAGTLIDGMDCMIAVRRDSAGMTIAGPYQVAGDATKFIGVAESGSPYLCVGIGAGAPTVWVDGIQLTGGTAVTPGTLHLSLTPGAWHIMEFRGLNLSTWTALAIGAYGSGYNLNGAIGKIQLFASGQDANRDLARAQMAAYFGVTLP